MRVANCATGSSAFTMRGLCCLLLRSRWTPRTTPTPATTANGLRLRTRGRRRCLLPRRLLGNRLRRATGTTWAPLAACLETTAPTVLRLRLVAGDASEQRLDRGTYLLLHRVSDHRHKASLSRHRPPLRRQIHERTISGKGCHACHVTSSHHPRSARGLCDHEPWTALVIPDRTSKSPDRLKRYLWAKPARRPF